MDKNEVLYEKCDVLVPAAIGNVITSDNANQLNCQYVVEAANGPTTPNVSFLCMPKPDVCPMKSLMSMYFVVKAIQIMFPFCLIILFVQACCFSYCCAAYGKTLSRLSAQ